MSKEVVANETPREVKAEELKKVNSPEPPKADVKKPLEEPPIKKEEKKPQEKENKEPKSVAAAKTNGDQASGGDSKQPALREQFKAFSKFGDTKSDGKHLTLSQSDKWMKQAKVIDPKGITTTDTAIHFKKFKQMKIVYPDYEKFLQDLAKAKNIEIETIKTKMRSCGLPGTSGTTAVVKSSAVDRLTDTKKFTGSHKIRVDPKAKASPSPRK